MNRNKTLNKLIYQTYLTSSLIPIFAIEILLLILYFGISYFITRNSQMILFQEAQKSLSEISVREVENIDKQFQEVVHTSKILRDDHERFFSLDQCVLPHGEPVFKVHSNGALYKAVDNGGGSIYYSTNTKIGSKELHKARCSEVMDPLLKSVVIHNPIITQAYFNSKDDFNRIYPYMDDSPSQYGPNLHMEDYNFYYLADAKHNPQRASLWTDAYLDPAGQGWMISNIVPIYYNNKLEGVTGVDVTIDSLINNVLSLKIPWEGSAFLVNDAGMILAMPEQIEAILGLKELKEHVYHTNIETTIEKPEEYNLLKSSNPQIKEQMQKVLKDLTPLGTLNIGKKQYLFSQYVIRATKWHLIILVDQEKVYAPINKLKNQANQLGYFVIAMMILFYVLFFMYLMRKSHRVASNIADPITQLSVMTSDLGKTTGSRIDQYAGVEELDQLVKNFNELSSQLDQRTQEYIQSQLREKMKEKDAEIAYRAGLFESASSYLHNIGNALTTLDAKIRMMKNVVKALHKSKLGINKAITMINASKAEKAEQHEINEYLLEFENALSTNITAEIEEITNDIDSIKQHAIDSIRHQQDVFNEGYSRSKNYFQKFNLKDVLEHLCDEYNLSASTKGITITLECDENIELYTMKFQLVSGLSNVIKNAIESIQSAKIGTNGKISITAQQINDKTRITVTDNGIGFDNNVQNKLFKAGYTTKKGGHGLGLHAFNNFINSNKGSITLQSDGLRSGATVRIELEESNV